MSKKYELTDETILLNDKKLYRIVALKDLNFGSVNRGDLGGFIEKEFNLSHKGESWVYDTAQVYGDACVYGDAGVFGKAQVFGNAHIFGDARIGENALIYGAASVHHTAEVFGNAEIYGNSEIYGKTSIFGKSRVSKTPITLSGDRRLYPVTITDNLIIIGCRALTLEEWLFLDYEDIDRLGRFALDFYVKYKYIIKALAENHQNKLK